MGSDYKLNMPAEQAREMPMVDLAFMVLKAANTPFYYRDLMTEIAKIKGFPDDKVMEVIAQLYTEINVDGRFACVGNNLWGLKRWYPVDNKSDDNVTGAKRPRIINDEDDDLDEEDVFHEEEETFTAEEEDFDSFDEDHEEVTAEEEEDEFYEEEDIDEEEDAEDAGLESDADSEEGLDEEADPEEDGGDEDDKDDKHEKAGK